MSSGRGDLAPACVVCRVDDKGASAQMQSRRGIKGFSLIELMVTVAVLAIVIGVATPSFRAIIENNRLTAQSNEMLTAFALARTEAVRRRVPVVVCPGPCDGSNDWQAGWSVRVEPATADINAAAAGLGAGSELVRTWPALPNPLNFENAADLPSIVRYTSNGRVSDLGGTLTFPVLFDLESPACSSNSARQIEITRPGRASATRKTCQHGSL